MAGEADKLNILGKLNIEYQRQIDNLKGITNQQERSRLATEQIANYQKMITELMKEQAESGKNNQAFIDELLNKQREIIASEKKINEQLQKQVKSRKLVVDLARQLGAQLKIGWQYLQDQDKIIKSTVLSLGMAGNKAVAMRDAFEASAGYVTRLGGTIAEIGTVMQGYADETGRARVMTADMVKDITAIGKGTGLGIEQATRLGAQFELMGFNTKTTMDYVQGVVDTSERMGVNTTKVLKTVNDNFKKLNTYTFQQGVKGFAEMAMYAEKFKIDISQALNAADVARSLEGVIDLAAQLQVMGGEFAKTDPFEMLFLARNDPAKFTEKIADMTKGLVTFRRMADGTFEKFISPADRDRIAAVAKSMGMEASELTVIAERQAEIQKMRQQMAGLGLSKEQQKLVEGAALWDAKTGKFQVQLAGTMESIGTLTRDQAESFASEQISLEERAKQAMTFNDTLKATVETLKAALLPILNAINVVLKPLAKVADAFSKLAGTGPGGIAKAAGLLVAGAMALKIASLAMSMQMSKLIGGTKVGSLLGGGGARGVGGVARGGIATGAPGSMFTKTGMVRKGAAGLQKAQGMKAMGRGLGAGGAMAGAGAGIMMAAKGLAELATAMKDLTPEQAKTLERIAITMAVTFPLAAIGIALLGTTATASAPGLLALGAAVLMIGGAVGIAAAGIGFMAKGFAEMFEASKDAGDNMPKLVGGMTGLVAVLGAATLTIPSAIALSMLLKRMGKAAPQLATVGVSLQKIKAGLSGSREDYEAIAEAIKTISGIRLKKNNAISQMAEMLNKPLKVEFEKGKVNLVNDITLNLDGKRFMQKSYNVDIALQKHEDLRHNKGS